MNEPRDIIREFSTFCILEDRNSYKIPVLKSDRELERTIGNLVNGTASRVNKDAWARYFLIVARQTDPQFTASLNISASSDYELQHTIERLIELAPEPNQDVRVVYIDIIARTSDRVVANYLQNSVPASKKLLSAHVQKVCWYAAKDFYEKRIQFSNLRYQYPLEECLQIASLRASEPTKLLKNFDLKYRRITIKSYAEKRLWGTISDKIRAQNIEAKTKSLSDDGILRTLAKTELIEALKVTNYQLEINSYCLALQCYKEIHQPKQIERDRLAAPTKEQLQQIADRYNQRYQEFNILNSIDLNDITFILKTCVQIIRTYRSSDSVIGRIQEYSNILTGDPLNKLIEAEEVSNQNEEVKQIKLIIIDNFISLPDIAQKTLKLWFGLELTQNDILLLLGQLLGLQKQYEVSRKIKQYKKVLLKALVQELSEKYAEVFQPNRLDRVIERLQEPVDECLKNYCKSFFYPPLDSHLQLFEQKDKLLLHLHYRQQLHEQNIAEQLRISVIEVNARLNEINYSLQAIFKQWVETTLDIALDLCNSAEQKLASFVKTWLQDCATLEV
ncbi:hypothetical protein [Aliterella atlantica]|uniref:Uncharacterized protein n=1 Tax=Aliterella atlantica CENA595 TaxID=1618023 RepID=A0A0D8ZT82_9CYAN|nr:hypothetical protein [Aliterella atlantica]KJH71955.1 hypothetical protein UH38_09560 [Aliterella atlantica CENA595]